MSPSTQLKVFASPLRSIPATSVKFSPRKCTCSFRDFYTATRHRRRKQMKHRVLAIGLDAADSKLIRLLIDQGEMPVLGSVLAEGRWIDIDSTADVGSSSVWPTFTTGQDPDVHGMYSEWCWEPQSMGLSMLSGEQLNPFWKMLSQKGHSVGVLGVPFMPLVGLS